MTEDDPPRPTGRIAEFAIDGCLFPWKDGEPVLVQVPGSGDFLLPLFTHIDLLVATMSRGGIAYQSIKCIDDGNEFLASMPESIEGRPLRLIQDLHFTEGGRVRYLQVFAEDGP